MQAGALPIMTGSLRVQHPKADKASAIKKIEDDPVGPMTPGSTTKIVTSSAPVAEKTSRKTHAVSFTRAASASTDGGDLDDEEWVDPTSVPAMSLDATPPSKALFQRGAASAPVAPMMAKTKSSSSNSHWKESQAPDEARAPVISPSALVPFPSSSPSREQGMWPVRRRVGTMNARGAYRR